MSRVGAPGGWRSSSGEPHGVAGAPEDQRQAEVDDEHERDGQAHGPPHGVAHVLGASGHAEPVGAVDEGDDGDEDEDLDDAVDDVDPWQVQVEVLVVHPRSEEHTSELQSLMRNSYAVFCLKKKKKTITHNENDK